MKAIKDIFKSFYFLRGLFLSFPFHPSLRSVCQAHSSTLSSISPFGRNRVIFSLYIQFSHNIFYSSFSISLQYSILLLPSFASLIQVRRALVQGYFRVFATLNLFRPFSRILPFPSISHPFTSFSGSIFQFTSGHYDSFLRSTPLTSFKVSLSLESSFSISVGDNIFQFRIRKHSQVIFF